MFILVGVLLAIECVLRMIAIGRVKALTETPTNPTD